jgi:hypothetical protein
VTATSTERTAMSAAIALAALAQGRTGPDPVARDASGEPAGQGHHAFAGAPHTETVRGDAARLTRARPGRQHATRQHASRKFAATPGGRPAADGTRRWITGPAAQDVHRPRAHRLDLEDITTVGPGPRITAAPRDRADRTESDRRTAAPVAARREH